MAHAIESSDQDCSFQFLRPGSSLFQLFFVGVHAEFMDGRLREDAATERAYGEFCRIVAGCGGGGIQGKEIAGSPDFQHDVFVRFEKRKLAERYDPALGTPAAYITGVASMMIRERRRQRAERGALDSNEIADHRVRDAERKASAREVTDIVAELMHSLPPAQHRAILKKYSQVRMIAENDPKTVVREYVLRCRGIAKLREWLMERGIVDF